MSTKQCNLCLYQKVAARAAKEGKKVTRIPDKEYELGGEDVYIHPKDVDIQTLSKKARERYWRGWYMLIPEKCEC